MENSAWNKGWIIGNVIAAGILGCMEMWGEAGLFIIAAAAISLIDDFINPPSDG